MKATPLAALEYGNPQAARLVSWQHAVRKQVDEIIAKNETGKKTAGTIFQAILDSDLPPSEKTAQRLQDEGQVVVGAGSETTAKSLSMVLFFLLSDRSKLQKLRDEIETIRPQADGSFQLCDLERLRYLVSIFGFRMCQC